MIFFTKKKAYLRDLIPNGYVDIHSHLLFGIDDGCKDETDTISLTRALMGMGFAEIITTPHTMQHVWDNTIETITDAYNLCMPVLRSNNIHIPFKAASEYLIDDNFVKLFKEGKLMTLKDNYVLVEMSYLNAPLQLFEVIYELQIAGYKPVLAHPERYSFFHHSHSQYTKLKKAGCLFQLNLLSITGYYGSGVAKMAKQLLLGGQIDFVGSDLHHKNHLAAFQNSRILIKDLAPLKLAFSNNAMFSQT